MSFLTSYLLRLAPNRELAPALEPEFTCPAVEEHATFAEAMHSLERYLEDVCGFEKNEMGHGGWPKESKRPRSMPQRSRI